VIVVVCSCRGGYSRQQCHGKFRPVRAKVVAVQMDPARSFAQAIIDCQLSP
jgi:hypothetical protein